MPEDKNNEGQQQQPAQPPAPTGAPVAPQPPVAPGSQQPAQGAQTPEQPAGHGEQQAPNQQQNSEQGKQTPQPTFRPNGAFSFFATPSDPDEDSAPMSIGFKIGWLVLGLIGGILGLMMAFISTTTLSQKRRRQALFYTWIGFAIQAVLFLLFNLTGGALPFGGETSSTAAQSSSAGTGSTSAFG